MVERARLEIVYVLKKASRVRIPLSPPGFAYPGLPAWQATPGAASLFPNLASARLGPGKRVRAEFILSSESVSKGPARPV